MTEKLFQNYTTKQIDDILKIGMISGTQILIEEFQRRVQKKISKIPTQTDFFLNVCRQGNQHSLRIFNKLNINNIKDSNGNTCLHEAARYGNINMLRQLQKIKDINFNAVNNQHQTPLFYSLLRNQKKYEQIALFLLKKTDLRIRDSKNRLHHEITEIKFNESKARLFELLQQKYNNQSKQK